MNRKIGSLLLITFAILGTASAAKADSDNRPIYELKTLKLNRGIFINDQQVAGYFQGGEYFPTTGGTFSDLIPTAEKMDENEPWCAFWSLSGKARTIPEKTDMNVVSATVENSRTVLILDSNDLWSIQCNRKTETVKDAKQVFGGRLGYTLK